MGYKVPRGWSEYGKFVGLGIKHTFENHKTHKRLFVYKLSKKARLPFCLEYNKFVYGKYINEKEAVKGAERFMEERKEQ